MTPRVDCLTLRRKMGIAMNFEIECEREEDGRLSEVARIAKRTGIAPITNALGIIR